jgi:hypothetical protein
MILRHGLFILDIGFVSFNLSDKRVDYRKVFSATMINLTVLGGSSNITRYFRWPERSRQK